MVRRCKVGMQSVPEAFRTPSKLDEQGMRTIDHMISDVFANFMPTLAHETES
jgi:hypothetical protein